MIDLSTRSNLNIPIVQISKSVAYSCIETVKEYFSYDKNALQKIKVMTINKLCRTINTIYFDLIEKVYFKKDKLKFDIDEPFIGLIELVLIYFNLDLNCLEDYEQTQ